MSDKYKSIFLGQVRRKMYYTSSLEPYQARETSEFVKNKKIYECELSRPPLTKDEKIYIPDLDTTLQITSVIKSVDGSITYHANYTIETIEDKKTEESYNEAIKGQEEHILNDRKDKEKDNNEVVGYKEYENIARNLYGHDNINIIVNCDKNGNLIILDTGSKNTIKLDKYTVEELMKFYKFAKQELSLV